MHQAFLLGAGLGTRLRPLTQRLPKPLVPLFHRPLAWWALSACADAGIRRFAINTHHLPEAWDDFTARPDMGDVELSLFHEPELLETGGGLKNIAEWMGDRPLLVHNGDIFSTLPLVRLIAAHEASALPVTLALRREGDARHIAVDPGGNLAIDIRNRLGRGEGTHVFSGIYCVNPEFLAMLPAGEKISVIPAFLELARDGRLGCTILDDGVWLDLGDRDSYLEAHRTLALDVAVHPDALIAPGARVENSVIGPGCRVETGASIRDSVLWPGTTVGSGARLDRCIVCSPALVTGRHVNGDL